MSFFICDVKGEETAKKIVTKFCNQNDCFAYLLLDTKDHTQSAEGFDKLIEDVGESNLLKVSDYKHLTQHSGPRKQGVRNSKGSVSDQDVFFIYGADDKAKKISNPYNDAVCLSVLSEDELEDFLDEDEIVYVPMLRYKTAEDSTQPEISEIHYALQDERLKPIIKDLVGNTKIYAIKSAFANKLEKDGYNMITFNEFLKRQLKVVAKKHFEHVSSYNALVEYAKKEYNKEDKSEGYSYYNYGTVDKQFMFHMLNIFGLEYAKFISNKTLVSAIDSTMILEFFTHTVHEHEFSIGRFNQTDYFAHITKLLDAIGIKAIDSKQIRNSNISYNNLIHHLENKLYVGELSSLAKEYVNIIKPEVSDNHKLPKITETRENIKAEVDKNPMLKYILGTRRVSGNLRELKTNRNPVNQLDERYGHYNSNSKDWYTQMSQDNTDLFKIQLSSLIK
jgi:hypothetical protein